MDGRGVCTAVASLRGDEAISTEGPAVGLGAGDARSGVDDDDDPGRRRDGVVAGRRRDDGNGAPSFPSLPESKSPAFLVSPRTSTLLTLLAGVTGFCASRIARPGIGDTPCRVGCGILEMRGEGIGRRDGGWSGVAMMDGCGCILSTRRKAQREASKMA